MEKKLHIFFEGRVQGVGFRFTAYSLAHKFNIKGWVRNLRDGRVELVAEGQEKDMEFFLTELNKEFKGYITNSVVEKSTHQESFNDFQIRY